MKKTILILAIVLMHWQFAHSQYSWFNRKYPMVNLPSFVAAMNCRGDSLETFLFAYGSDENHPSQYGICQLSMAADDGTLISESMCFPNVAISEQEVGSRSNSTMTKLQDDTWLYMASQYSDCQMVLPSVLHISKDNSLISQRTLSEINDCEDKVYFSECLFDLGYPEYLLTTRVYFGWPVSDSSGHYFHRMNLDGEIVESSTVMIPNSGSDRTYHQLLGMGSDSLIIYGEAGENFTAIGPFIQKTDLRGNVTHELLINNDDLVWGELVASGTINLENELIYAHVNTTYFNVGESYGEFQLFIKRIDTHNLEIIENKPINLPFLLGNQYGAFNIEKIIQTIEGGYLLLITIVNDGAVGAYTGLLKLDQELNSEWFKTYHPDGWIVSEVASCTDMIQTPDGGYAMAGRYGLMSWVVKLDHCGNEIESDCDEIISVEENQNFVNHLNLYPNPANNEINIITSNLIIKPQYIEVYSTDGRLLLQEKLLSNNSTLTLSIAGVPSGNYIVVLKDDKGRLAGREILVKN
jgi:hypothetical protein